MMIRFGADHTDSNGQEMEARSQSSVSLSWKDLFLLEQAILPGTDQSRGTSRNSGTSHLNGTN
jgi:hypothetical protein